MRTARHKTVRDAKKRIPYGIERQNVLLELVERRLKEEEQRIDKLLEDLIDDEEDMRI